MFHGSIVALVTPFTESSLVDYDALTELINMHLAAHTNGMVVLGTTGESPTITHSERQHIIKHVCKQVNEQFPVIVGTGTNSTQSTIQLTEEAMHSGADAALIVTPYYNCPPQAGLLAHFKRIAHSVPIPQILYNNPARAVVNLEIATVKELSKIPNIVAIKEAITDKNRLIDLKHNCGDSLDFLSGDDGTACEFMLAGGKGVISSVANIIPEQIHQVWKHIHGGETDQAKALNENLNTVYEAMAVQTNPIPLKYALSTLGKIKNILREPLLPLDETHVPQVERALSKIEKIS